MKSENLVPKVRFKGFSDPWEQRKLKLLADFSKGAGYSKKDIIDQGTPIVLYGRLYTNYQVNITTIKDTFVKIRPGSVFSECKDVIVPASGETAEDIARASHVCISGAVLGGDLNIIKPKINIIDSSFLALCISNGQQNKELIKRAQGKSIVHLHNSDLKQVVLKYPSKRNQSMIARIFDKTDSLIAANEDKLEQLKTLKKLMMQKIFSQEWRFKGFTDPWEQRKLGNISIIKGRLGWKSLKQGEYTSSGPSMIAGRHIVNGEIDWGKVDHIPEWRYQESPEIALKNDDVIFSKDGSLGNPALIHGLKDEATINSTMMLVRTDNSINSGFFYEILLTEQFQRLIYLKVSGSSIPHLFQADMNNFEIMVPTHDEQDKITNVLFKLDNLIAANEDKLNQLKELKKYLMQNMFV